MAKKYSKENIKKNKDEVNKSYSLHVDAVEKLVSADEGNVPEVSDKEIKQYSGDKLAKIPIWIKAIFIKYWFYGACHFFLIFGLSTIINNFLDQVLLFAVAGGAVTDLLVNNIFAYFDDEGAYTKWSFFYNRHFWSVFVNMLYCGVLFFIVGMIYNCINKMIIFLGSLDPSAVPFGMEPFGFALIILLVDLAFIGIKMFFKKLIADANAKLSNK